MVVQSLLSLIPTGLLLDPLTVLFIPLETALPEESDLICDCLGDLVLGDILAALSALAVS